MNINDDNKSLESVIFQYWFYLSIVINNMNNNKRSMIYYWFIQFQTTSDLDPRIIVPQAAVASLLG